MTKSRHVLAPRQNWKAWELTMLREHYSTTPTALLAQVFERRVGSILQKAGKLGLKKSIELIAEMARERTSDPNHGSRATRLQPGNVPANKGLKHPPGWAPGRMAATQFKPGSVPHTWKPVGTLVVIEGYLHKKMNDLPGPKHVRWLMVHRMVWEAANGAVPAGHVVVFKPGSQSVVEAEITSETVELVTRAQLMARNTINNHPKPLADVMRLRGALNRQINKRSEQP